MKNIYKIGLLVLSLIVLNSCSEDETFSDNLDYTSFAEDIALVFLKSDSQKEVTYEIYGTQSLGEQVSLEVAEESTLNSDYYSIGEFAYEGNKGSFTITFSNYDVDMIDGQSIVVNLMSQGYVGSSMTINTTPDCPILNITFDDYAEEAAWMIADASGTTVATGGITDGSYNEEYAGMISTSISLCQLTPGTYTISIFDSYEDGGTGYAMYANEGQNLVLSVAGDSYEASTSAEFTIE
ncbi:hypothetical protein N9L20_07375 [Flavobacteriaceae bacterium]|nr:hypothetical protein [Flavobacteriaceae bacterium]